MLRTIILFASCHISLTLYGQTILTDFLKDGDFEVYKKCPTGYNSDYAAFPVTFWNSPTTGTPDYYNVCGLDGAAAPANWAGVAVPNRGNGYAGLYLWQKTGTNYREYIQGELSRPLLPGSYIVTFLLRPSSGSGYAVNRIGIGFSENKVRLSHDRVLRLDDVIEVQSDTIMDLGQHWTKFQLNVELKKPYQYMIIGNFSDDENTRSKSLFPKNGHWMLKDRAYYYIDNITLDGPSVPPAYVVGREFISDSVFFLLNKAELPAQAKTYLDNLGKFLSESGEYLLRVKGYADKTGSQAYNADLSLRRASNVRAYLVEKFSIEASRITAEGYGEISEGLDSLNRKVSFELIKK